MISAIGRTVPVSTEPGPWWIPFVVLGVAGWIMLQFTAKNRLKWKTRVESGAAPLFQHVAKDIEVTAVMVWWEILKAYAWYRKHVSLRRVKDEIRRLDDEWKKLSGEETN